MLKDLARADRVIKKDGRREAYRPKTALWKTAWRLAGSSHEADELHVARTATGNNETEGG